MAGPASACVDKVGVSSVGLGDGGAQVHGVVPLFPISGHLTFGKCFGTLDGL
jgi:hypothetical protein